MDKSFIVNLGSDSSEELIIEGHEDIIPESEETGPERHAVIINCEPLLSWLSAIDSNFLDGESYAGVTCDLVGDTVVRIYGGITGDIH